MRVAKDISCVAALFLAIFWLLGNLGSASFRWRDPVKAHEYVALDNAKSFVGGWNEQNVLYRLRHCKVIDSETAGEIRQTADLAKQQYGPRIDIVNGMLIPAECNAKIVEGLNDLFASAQNLEAVVIHREALEGGNPAAKQAFLVVWDRATALVGLMDQEIASVKASAVSESDLLVRLSERVRQNTLWLAAPAALLALIFSALCTLKARAPASQEGC